MRRGLTDEIEIGQERGSGLVQSFPKRIVASSLFVNEAFESTEAQQILKAFT